MSPSETDSSSASPLAKGEAAITQRHYQALCGLALAAVFLIQLQQSSLAAPITLVANLLVVFIGTLGILYRVRLSPILVLVALAVPQLIAQHQMNQLFRPEFRFLDVGDVLVCMALLTYLIGQYRLHGLWFGVLPRDARQTPQAQMRSAASLSAAELMGLIFPVPIFAMLAEFAALLLKQPWTIGELPPRERQLLAAAWAILLAMFLGAHAFRYWRRAQMDRVSSMLLLQDVFWDETRGEQRGINRWIVWKKRQSLKR